MSKQCLDVHQMQHLQELGLELKETMLYWARCVDNNPRAATHYGKCVDADIVTLARWSVGAADALIAELKKGDER